MTAKATRTSEQTRTLADEFWSEFQTFGLEIPVRRGAPPTAVTWEIFSERFDRSFRMLASYVGRRVNDHDRFKCILVEVLTGNLDLFTTPCEDREKAARLLKDSADRLIALWP